MKHKNKRGNVIDIIFLPILIIVISVFLIITVRTTNQVKEGFMDSLGNDVSSPVVNESLESVSTTNNLWDFIWIFIIFGTMLGVWISAFFVRTYPVFFWIALVIFLVVLFLIPTVANVYSSVTNSTEFESTATLSFPKTSWVISHYPLIILLFIMVTAILLYSGTSSEAGL